MGLGPGFLSFAFCFGPARLITGLLTEEVNFLLPYGTALGPKILRNSACSLHIYFFPVFFLFFYKMVSQFVEYQPAKLADRVTALNNIFLLG